MQSWLGSFLIEEKRVESEEEEEDLGLVGFDVELQKCPLVKILQVGDFGVNCIVISDPDSKDCVVVDPGAELDTIVEYIEDEELHVKEIILTHCHFDQLLVSGLLSDKYGVPVRANPADKVLQLFGGIELRNLGIQVSEELLASVKEPVFDLLEGVVQSACGLTVLYTPGHTNGSISLYSKIGKFVLTGDLLRYDELGSVNGMGGAPEKLRSSLEKQFAQPQNTKVIPARGKCTSIGRERYNNASVRALFK